MNRVKEFKNMFKIVDIYFKNGLIIKRLILAIVSR